MNRFAVSLVAAVLAFVLGGSSVSAEPQGPWVLPVEDLSEAGQSASDPQVSAAPDGTATAVWRRSDGANTIIQAATRPPGGSFDTPVDLSDAGQSALEPQITTAPDGTATVVWQRFDGANTIIQAATRPPGGSFGTPVDLSASGISSAQPRIGTAADGTTTAVWSGGGGLIQAATRPPGGSFGTPVDLSALGGPAFNPQIAASLDGTLVVVWQRFDGTVDVVQASVRPPGGSFGAPVDLSAPGKFTNFPHVAAAADGTATAVWEGFDGVSNIIQAATRLPDGSFTTPVDLSAPGNFASEPRAAVGPDGTVTVVWYRDDGADDIVQAATRPPGGSFGVPVNLSAIGQDAREPGISTAADGTTIVVWRRFDGADTIVQAAKRPPGGSFAMPVDLSAAGQGASEPRISTSPNGATTAVWRRSNGANLIVQSVSTAPVSRLLQINRQGSGSGSVVSGPEGIDCGTDCAEIYPLSTVVALKANPDPGSTFTGWTGAGCAGTDTCDLTILEATTLTASFGRPELADPRIAPSFRKVKRGRRAAFKVAVRNTGDATARRVKLCAGGPKKLIMVAQCRRLGKLAAGKSKTVDFRVKVKNRAKRGSKARLTLAARAKGLGKKTGKATIRVR